MTTVKGAPWQDVLGLSVLLGTTLAGSAGGAGLWDTGLWDTATWAATWVPGFTDVTADVIDVHTASGAIGLELSAGVGSLTMTLYDSDGRYTPDGSVDWVLGRHVKITLTPAGYPPVASWYGVVDKAQAGGPFHAPTLEITAYDVRSIVAAAQSTATVGNTVQRADTRLVAILTAAGFPADQIAVATDPTQLLADDTVKLGDLLSRTVESAGDLFGGTASDGSAICRRGGPRGPVAPRPR